MKYILVKYKYDSWGNIISITNNYDIDITNQNNNIGNINPIRFRSYYYDKESDLYYLKSRYYSPKLHRFINCDSIISESNIFKKLYIYCSNDPINNIDPAGKKLINLLFNFAKKAVAKVAQTLYNLYKTVSKYVGVETSNSRVEQVEYPTNPVISVSSYREIKTNIKSNNKKILFATSISKDPEETYFEIKTNFSKITNIDFSWNSEFTTLKAIGSNGNELFVGRNMKYVFFGKGIDAEVDVDDLPVGGEAELYTQVNINPVIFALVTVAAVYVYSTVVAPLATPVAAPALTF